jgi:5-methylcytosine-specific restriction enzyme subunit McrC
VNRNLPIQVFEFEKLTLDSDTKGRFLTQRELNRLIEFNDKNKNIYFNVIRNGVKFKNYVGVIQLGGLTIEILPKSDKYIINNESDFKTWHSVLISMLKICKYLKVNSESEAKLKQRQNSILELYFDTYLNEVELLLHKGLIKQYRKQSSNILVYKGKINFNKQIQKNLFHQERFYTEHQIYDHENLANQILLKGLQIIDRFVTNFSIKDKIARLKLKFPQINEILIHRHHFDLLKNNKKTLRYKKALQIAQMLIFNYSPDIVKGQENMLALLI